MADTPYGKNIASITWDDSSSATLAFEDGSLLQITGTGLSLDVDGTGKSIAEIDWSDDLSTAHLLYEDSTQTAVTGADIKLQYWRSAAEREESP